LNKLAQSLNQALAPFKRRFAWATVYFLVVLLIGTLGYRLIEGWGWFDSFYMAVTTITAVGFQEVHPLSPPGRSLTTVLIIFGITGLGIWWGLITALILELDLGGLLRRRRIMRELSHMSDHFIICGGGRMGRIIIEEMVRSNRRFVVIEAEPNRVAEILKDYPEILMATEDATREHTLISVGIERAAGLAACLTDDADNLLLCLTARGLCPDLTIVARAANEETLDKLSRAGADHAISPNVTGGVRMASMLLRPSVVNFLDVATTGVGDVTLRLEEVEIPASSHLAGVSIADARIRERTGLVVLALRRGGRGGKVQYNPGPENRLDPEDVLIVLGAGEQVESLRRYVQSGG
jgi:voltage-gated potassium channel